MTEIKKQKASEKIRYYKNENGHNSRLSAKTDCISEI